MKTITKTVNRGGSQNVSNGGGFGKMLGKITGKGMLQGAAGMLVMAGAMWVMSKALRNFQGLDWETLGMAAATLSGMIGGMALMGKIAEATFPAIFMGSVAIAAIGVALIPAAYSMTLFTSAIMPLVNSGQNLLSVAGGIAAIGGAMAVFGAGGLLAGFGTLGGLTSLNTIGKFVEKYSSPLTVAGVAIQNMADGMERIATAGKLTSLQALVSTNGGRGVSMLENHVRIDIDGKQVAKALEYTIAGDK